MTVPRFKQYDLQYTGADAQLADIVASIDHMLASLFEDLEAVAKATPAATTSTASVIPGTCNGRLTLVSGTPIPSSDQIGKSTLYFTPFNGYNIAIYNGTAWVSFTFTEISLALSGLTAGKNYDVFIYDNSGTRTLELSAAWASDTARTDAIALQNGVYVKSSATTRLHLGTIRATGTTTTEDSEGGTSSQVGGKRFVWNRFNQIIRPLAVIDTTASWTYTTTSWRQANAATGNKVEFVVGDTTPNVDAFVQSTVGQQTNTGTLAASVAIGVDSTTTPSGIHSGGFLNGTPFDLAPVNGLYRAPITLGYHALNWLEFGIPGTQNLFYGSNTGAGDIQSGLYASLAL